MPLWELPFLASRDTDLIAFISENDQRTLLHMQLLHLLLLLIGSKIQFSRRKVLSPAFSETRFSKSLNVQLRLQLHCAIYRPDSCTGAMLFCKFETDKISINKFE